MNDAVAAGGWLTRFVTATDGLKLHVRDYGGAAAAGVPVVCLPGLARTSADFDALAATLANETADPHRVLALDYRGRGRSDYDDDPDRYTMPVELADLIAVLTALEIGPAVFVGTSRGGLLTMVLAAARPTAIAGAVLNDIGPVIELEGLIRIKSYIGKLPQLRTWEEGADVLRRLLGAQFPKLSAEDWLAFARRTWTERDGALLLDYDPQLAQTLRSLDLEHPLPTMWPQFDALPSAPLMLIRGGLSDVLSAATAEAMRARRPDLVYLEVADQGHAPLLSEPPVIRRIADFAAACAKTSRH